MIACILLRFGHLSYFSLPFCPLSNLLFVNGEMTSSHRIVRSFGKGNHLKLEVSCVTVTVSLHDGKKEMLIKMVQRLKRNCSRQRTRLDSNWTGKNLLASCLIRLRELKLLPLGFYFTANQSVLSPLVKHAFHAVLLEIFLTGFTRLEYLCCFGDIFEL